MVNLLYPSHRLLGSPGSSLLDQLSHRFVKSEIAFPRRTNGSHTSSSIMMMIDRQPTSTADSKGHGLSYPCFVYLRLEHLDTTTIVV